MDQSMPWRIRLPMMAVAAGAFVVFFSNQIRPHVGNRDQSWHEAYLFPTERPVGVDFRYGLYNPASTLLQGGDPYEYGLWYPPFSVVFSMPFQLFGVEKAYAAQIVLLFVLNIAAVWFCVSIARVVFTSEGSPGEDAAEGITFPFFLCFAFMVISSYGFLFSVERGNFDIYTMVASLAGLILLIRRPNSIWLPVICFSVAAHLKVYPAILYGLIMWRHGRKSIGPLLLVNGAFFLCLGFSPVIHFLNVIHGVTGSPAIWVGNHSAASFSSAVNTYLAARGLSPLPGLVFFVMPLIVWLVPVLRLFKQGHSDRGAVWFFVLCVPLMNLIPSTSHDYKLVLLTSPLAVLLLSRIRESGFTGRRILALQLIAGTALAVFLSLSYTAFPPVLGNKYPFILALQLLLAWAVFSSPPVTHGGVVHRETAPPTPERTGSSSDEAIQVYLVPVDP